MISTLQVVPGYEITECFGMVYSHIDYMGGIDDVQDELEGNAKDMGGNAVINVQVTCITQSKSDGMMLFTGEAVTLTKHAAAAQPHTSM